MSAANPLPASLCPNPLPTSPLSVSGLVHFPHTPGASLIISLRRRALAPLAWLRAMRRGARARAPDLRSGPPYCHRLAGWRARPAPWCGGGRGRRAPASAHAKRNPKDIDSRNGRALLDQAAAAGAAGGRGRGHRGRRHHRRDHGSHPGRGRRVLALGRRPLHQERARPDPPTAGDRPRDRDVGAGARRPCARPRGGSSWSRPCGR